MAQKSLVRQPLTEQMIKAGGNLLRMLSERRFPFRAALWLYLSEAQEWTLVLAVPKARILKSAATPILPICAYGIVHKR